LAAAPPKWGTNAAASEMSSTCRSQTRSTIASPRHRVGTGRTLTCAPVPAAEHLEEIDEQPIFWRTAPWEGTPVVYVHGVPCASDLWQPFLERTGGVAPDLPGFGRSAKRGDFDYSIAGYDRWLERFLGHVEVDRFRLVLHDWGAVALAPAQRMPERIERLVVVNAGPLLPGYRWHWAARVWRRRGLGELAMGVVGLATRIATRISCAGYVIVVTALHHLAVGQRRP
jgi:pimeloyl-ACP methyl ester carboxylesterase